MISIITVNYNNNVGLKKTIESVINQTCNYFEYIVIDGGSTDGSEQIIKDFNDNISYWISEKDSGIYQAMNKGIRKAKGDFLLFLNSGDYLSNSNVINEVALHLSTNSKNAVYYGNYIFEDSDGSTEIRHTPKSITLDWLLSGSLPHPSTFIPRAYFNQYGLYDESYDIVADWVFFLNIFFKPGVVFQHIPIAVSVFTAGGISSSYASQNMLQSERAIGLKRTVPESILSLIERNRLLESYFSKLRILYFVDILKYCRKLAITFFSPFKKLNNSVLSSINSFTTKLFYDKHRNRFLQFSKSIPIIINNRNRLSYLNSLIVSLEKRGYTNIYIIDNNSTYQPLLEYYKTIPYKVYSLSKNVGFCALWDSLIFDDFRNQFYVYTDSDVVLSEECPDDFLCRLHYLLYKYSWIDKVGLGLIVSDLPNHYVFKETVFKWETDLIKNARLLELNVVEASVDTTFALYRPNKVGPAGYLKSARTLGQLQVKHLPWYINFQQISNEEKFYLENAHTKHYTYWTAASKRHLEENIIASES